MESDFGGAGTNPYIGSFLAHDITTIISDITVIRLSRKWGEWEARAEIGCFDSWVGATRNRLGTRNKSIKLEL